jgi:hypothetical protein
MTDPITAWAAARPSTVGGRLLTVEDLSVRFRTEDGPVLAVDEVSFTMPTGRCSRWSASPAAARASPRWR